MAENWAQLFDRNEAAAEVCCAAGVEPSGMAVGRAFSQSG